MLLRHIWLTKISFFSLFVPQTFWEQMMRFESFDLLGCEGHGDLVFYFCFPFWGRRSLWRCVVGGAGTIGCPRLHRKGTECEQNFVVVFSEDDDGTLLLVASG
jgi:hypothetical protein